MEKNDLERQLNEAEDQYFRSAVQVADLYERYRSTVQDEKKEIETQLGNAASRFRQVGAEKRMLEEKLGSFGKGGDKMV